MDTVSYSEARKNLNKVMDKAAADRAPVLIKRQRGGGDVVLISESEWASIEETLHLLHAPKNAGRLLEVVRGFEAGEAEVPPLR